MESKGKGRAVDRPRGGAGTPAISFIEGSWVSVCWPQRCGIPGDPEIPILGCFPTAGRKHTPCLSLLSKYFCLCALLPGKPAPSRAEFGMLGEKPSGFCPSRVEGAYKKQGMRAPTPQGLPQPLTLRPAPQQVGAAPHQEGEHGEPQGRGLLLDDGAAVLGEALCGTERELRHHLLASPGQPRGAG